MDSKSLRMEIRRAAKAYAEGNKLPIDESHDSAIIFRDISDNFYPKSFRNISKCPDWERRIRKPHQNVPGVLEMQSSNSSDALLMNIFCHPDIRKWGGIANLLETNLETISFGYHAEVSRQGKGPELTEVDMALADVFCEAKLTESDFTQKRAEVVERYDALV